MLAYGRENSAHLHMQYFKARPQNSNRNDFGSRHALLFSVCTFTLRFRPFSSMSCATSGSDYWSRQQSEAGSADGSTGSAVGRAILPSGLRNLTLADEWNHSLNHVALPSGQRSLTFGACFNKSLSNASLPSGLQTLRFGDAFNMSLSLSHIHI